MVWSIKLCISCVHDQYSSQVHIAATRCTFDSACNVHASALARHYMELRLVMQLCLACSAVYLLAA